MDSILTDELFHRPGATCYATKIAARVTACEGESWPLSPEQTRQIHASCPSHEGALPEFHRGMGLV